MIGKDNSNLNTHLFQDIKKVISKKFEMTFLFFHIK